MNETIPDKEAYQTNRRRMCWAALGMMIACTAATIYDSARISDADSILMLRYLALSGLVGAYFELGDKSSKSCSAFEQMPWYFFFNVRTVYFACMMKNIFYTSIL